MKKTKKCEFLFVQIVSNSLDKLLYFSKIHYNVFFILQFIMMSYSSQEDRVWTFSSTCFLFIYLYHYYPFLLFPSMFLSFSGYLPNNLQSICQYVLFNLEWNLPLQCCCFKSIGKTILELFFKQTIFFSIHFQMLQELKKENFDLKLRLYMTQKNSEVRICTVVCRICTFGSCFLFIF